MSQPTAYEPQHGVMFQIFCRMLQTEKWQHCDYAGNTKEKDFLLEAYAFDYPISMKFKTIQLPKSYWPAMSIDVFQKELANSKKINQIPK
jgi:hypothetical protein